MIYSSWRPDKGGYNYFETAERRGYGDDLPVPRLRPRSPIGVASTSIGRTPKGPLQPAGSGALAKGCILPLDRSNLKGLSGPEGGNGMSVLGIVAGVICVSIVIALEYGSMTRKRSR